MVTEHALGAKQSSRRAPAAGVTQIASSARGVPGTLITEPMR